MDKNKSYLGLKRFCQREGADLFGVADISGIKNNFMFSQAVLKRFDRAVCFGIMLSRSVLEEIAGVPVPTKVYFHNYRTVNVLLDQIGLKACNYIQKKGYSALPVPASQILDWQSQKAHLSHKQIGCLAGLGWIGRNNLLVNKDLGSQFRLVSILTDMPLKADKPLKKDCGACRRCVTMCPAGAIKDDPLAFDYIKCFDKLKEFHRQRLAEQYICGVCVSACRGKI
ncbi:MAG: hypothetical protein WC723_06405 [Candidatus Omnitrophota bacterium]